jgi:hypothetical protein
MVRFISVCGLGVGFLLLSPNLRLTVSHGIQACTASMNQYSPYSYIAAAIGIFAVLTVCMHRSGNC